MTSPTPDDTITTGVAFCEGKVNLVKNANNDYKIGDVYLMKFDGCGSEQCGLRPGLVFQNNVGNHYSPNIIALPFTTAIKKANQPTHVFVPCEGTGLRMDSMVLCENPERMSKERIGRYLTTLSDEYMAKIAEANLLASSAISFIDPARLMEIQKKAISLNATSFVA